MDGKYLEEITVNGKTYVSKTDLMAIIRQEKKKCREGTEPGYMNRKKKERIAAELSLNHLGVLVNNRYYDFVVHPRINSHVIVSLGADGFIYLRGWCKHVTGREGQETPVFTDDPKEAKRFEDSDVCEEVINQILAEWPLMRLHHCCANFPWQEYGLRNMHAMYGWPKGKDPEEVIQDELYWVRTLG